MKNAEFIEQYQYKQPHCKYKLQNMKNMKV